ncbi:hypothetical protein [Sphingobium sp.]|uniref:hypothetical protein n=1 Tax=Sphingobium sp. TaxID=1912891 RepID=UPI0035C6E53A
MNVTTALNLLQIIGPIVARAPEFIALYEAAIAMLNADDQAVAKEALADIQADNDEGHARLQAKLAAAT